MKHSEIAKRRRMMTEYIKEHGALSTEEACRMFGVSDETIRKDFLVLEKMQIIEKRYGGARLLRSDETKPYMQREDEQYFAKAAIAERALALIPSAGQSTIALDMGTTVSMLAGLLSKRSGNFIITNSNGCIQRLTSGGNRLYVLGGEYNAESRVFEGETAYAALSQLSIDMVFLGTGGVRSRDGISTASFSDVRLKREYIRHSQRKIVLTDSSKFHTTALVEVSPWEDVDILITDRNIPKEAADQLDGKLELILV